MTTKVEVKNVPGLLITPEAFEKLKLYVKHCDIEISGLGEVIKTDKNDYLITELFLFEQECTGVSTELKTSDINKFIDQRLAEGKSVEHIKLWWHSHVNMGTFWSSTDENAINTIDNAVVISVVANKSNSFLARIDLFEPFRLSIDNIELKVAEPAVKEDDPLTVAIKKEIEEKVKTRSFTRYHRGRHSTLFDEDEYDGFYGMNFYNGGSETSRSVDRDFNRSLDMDNARDHMPSSSRGSRYTQAVPQVTRQKDTRTSSTKAMDIIRRGRHML